MKKTANKDTVRIHLEISQKCRETLEQLSKQTDVSLSDVIRKSLAIYDMMVRETTNGQVVILKDQKTGRERELLIV